MARLGKGDQAPKFHLRDQNGNGWSLSDFSGRFLILFFYKQDGTTKCTKEVEGFRDHHDAFREHGARVIGISADDEASHRKFAAHCRLPFNLLADTECDVAEAYRVIDDDRVKRTTFLIGPDGTVLAVYQNIRAAENHAAEVLEELRQHVALPAGKIPRQSRGKKSQDKSPPFATGEPSLPD